MDIPSERLIQTVTRVKHQDVVEEQLLGFCRRQDNVGKEFFCSRLYFLNSFSAISFKFFLHENGQFIVLKNFFKRMNAFSFDF